MADFGISKRMDDSEVTRVGTAKYMAPEMEDLHSKVDLSKIDQYSYGKVLEYLKEKSEPIPASLQDMINSCVSKDPNLRPSFQHISQFMEKMIIDKCIIKNK